MPNLTQKTQIVVKGYFRKCMFRLHCANLSIKLDLFPAAHDIPNSSREGSYDLFETPTPVNRKCPKVVQHGS